jgi:hypothetical protein
MAWMARAATAVVVAMSGAGCMSLVARNPVPDLPPERVNAEIPPEQLRDDLKAYFELIERTAPNPYLFVPREQVEARVVSVSAAIDRPLTRRTFMPYLREVMAAYRIGHHYALDPKEEFNAWIAAGGRPFPLKVRIEGDEVVIDSDEQPELKGALLRSINGAEAAEILARLRGATSSATDAYRDMTIAEGFHQRLWELGFESPYAIKAEAASGASLARTLPGADGKPIRTMFDRMFDSGGGDSAGTETSPSSPSADFSFRMLEGGVGLLRWDAMPMTARKSWEAFLQKTFQELQTTRATGLIIDMRSNGGGDSSLAAPLFAYITDKPFRFSGGKRWRLSQDYEQFFESCMQWWVRILPWKQFISPALASMKVGEERVFTNEPYTLEPLEPRFRGPVCVLIGPRTFSSAMMTTDAIATYGLAHLIGEPTGGVPTDLGEVGFQRLPNSGIVVAFCTALFIRADGNEKNRGPVMPNEVVPFETGRDAPLEAAVRWVKRQSEGG